jgi:hypothetical protein
MPICLAEGSACGPVETELGRNGGSANPIEANVGRHPLVRSWGQLPSGRASPMRLNGGLRTLNPTTGGPVPKYRRK